MVLLLAIELTTLLLARNGGRSLSSLWAFYSLLTFTGLLSPRVEKVRVLMLRVSMLMRMRGSDRVVLVTIAVFRVRVVLVTVWMGPLILSMPEMRVIEMTSASGLTPPVTLLLATMLCLLGCRQMRWVLVVWYIRR